MAAVEQSVGNHSAKHPRSLAQEAALGPEPFGPLPGFRFGLSFLTAEGLQKEGEAAGAVAGGKLLLALYTGAHAHYYPKLKPEFDAILKSVTVP